MRVHLWGTDFRRSDSDFRGKLFLPAEVREGFIKDCLSMGFEDLVYLNTCNRIEFYTTVSDYFSDSRPLWGKLLSRLGLAQEDFFKGYQLEGKSALRHMLRVAASLESMVIGEPQILGQLKEAVQWTKERAFPLNSSLLKCFHLAFETAKEVRSTTSLAEKPISIASLGIQRVEKELDHLPIESVVVVGRSPLSLQVIQWLQKSHASVKIIWVNRRVEVLKESPEAEKVELVGLASFLTNPPVFSHLFTATSSPEAIFTDSFFSRLCKKRRMVIDFAQPADVHCEKSPEIELVSLESLRQEAEENALHRAAGAHEAEKIIERSLREFYLSQKETPILKSFNDVEPLLLQELSEVCFLIEKEFPSEWHSKMKKVAEKLTRRNLHQSREYLRTLLRQMSMPKTPNSEGFEAESLFG